jgi:hypothetical protein
VINRLNHGTSNLEFSGDPASYEQKLIFCFHTGELLNSRTLAAAIYLSLPHREHLCQLTAKTLKSSVFIKAVSPTHLYSLTRSTTKIVFCTLCITQAT